MSYRVFGRLPSDMLDALTRTGARAHGLRWFSSLERYVNRLSEQCAVCRARCGGEAGWRHGKWHLPGSLIPLLNNFSCLLLLCSWASDLVSNLFSICMDSTQKRLYYIPILYVLNGGGNKSSWKTQCKTIVRGSLPAVECKFNDTFERVVKSFSPPNSEMSLKFLNASYLHDEFTNSIIQ